MPPPPKNHFLSELPKFMTSFTTDRVRPPISVCSLHPKIKSSQRENKWKIHENSFLWSLLVWNYTSGAKACIIRKRLRTWWGWMTGLEKINFVGEAEREIELDIWQWNKKKMPFDILILDGKRQGHSYSSQVGNSRRGVVIRDENFWSVNA